MAATPKTRISLFFDTNVNANSTDLQLGAVVPNGRSVSIKRFGGSVPDGINGAVALQWGSGGSFTTIRAIQREMEFKELGEFVGDGVKRFRLARINRQTLGAQAIVAWLEAVVHDA